MVSLQNRLCLERPSESQLTPFAYCPFDRLCSHCSLQTIFLSPLLSVSLLLLCLRTQGRAFIDRNPDLFSYVLDYLRNGGTLPPLPKDDELLVERIRREFDYFCVIPNPVARSWVEKLRDGDYTAEIVEVCIRSFHVLLPAFPSCL